MLRFMGAATLSLLGLGLVMSPASALTTFTQANGSLSYVPPGTLPDTGVTEHKVFIDASGASTNHTGNVGGQTSLPATTFQIDVALPTSDGHAAIGSGGGGAEVFHSMEFAVPGYNIHDFIFDTNGAAANIRGNGQNDVTVQGFFGNVLVPLFSQTVTGLKTGNFSWLLLAALDVDFSRILVTSNSGFTQINHMFVSGSGNDLTPTPNTVPLPAGVWLFGTALAGMGALKMRRRRATAAA
jgi:hypothetical protein